MKNIFIGVPRSRIIKDFILAVAISLLNCGFTQIMSMTVSYFVKDTFMMFIVSVLVLHAVFSLFLFLQVVHQEVTECAIENGVYTYYMNKLYDVKSSILKKSNTGYMSGLLNKLVVRQVDAYIHVVCSVPIDIAYITYIAVVLYKFNWIMSIAAITVCVSSAVLRVTVRKRLHKLGGRVAECEGNRTKLFTDAVSNIETVQKMSAIKFIGDRAKFTNDECLRYYKRYVILDQISSTIGKALTFSFGPICLIAMYFMDKDILSANLSQVALVVAVSTQLPHNAKSFARTISSCNKFRDTATKLEEVVVDANIRKIEGRQPFKHLSMCHVNHHYVDESRNIDIEVKIPRFNLNRGEKICVTGESGQGKTTLLNILAGCIECESLKINGNFEYGRLNCVFISQDVEIFDMSLRDNLCLGNKNVSNREMEHLLKSVGMYDWFESIGKDWDTPLGERGVFVSTGQRQRLNLCRGLLAEDKDVYLLDEPTSNVDDETEKLMVELIKEYLANKTVVIVTHRPLLRTICDYEYKFSNGVLGDKRKI